VIDMAVVKADLGACQGYANCVVGAEDVFDINDDGVVVLLKTTVPDADRARVEEAARSCPVSALVVEDA
jgi:ferredoxin